jgi:peptidoglycan/xylan/chitin deacetylase (PgdA/CDA1 family)
MSIYKRIISKLERTIVDTVFFTNLEKLLISGKKINKILMYHGVDLDEKTIFNSRFIGVKNFQKQILFLKKHTNIISLKDYMDGKFDPNKSNIAITFDDGFLNNYKYILPFLEAVKVKASIYVTGLNNTEYDILWPDYLDIASYFMSKQIEIEGVIYSKNKEGRYYSEELNLSLNQVIKEKGSFDFKKTVFNELDERCPDFKNDEKYLDYWKLMSDAQLQEVDSSKYISIESHAFWHNNLGNISIEKATQELVDSKKYLENLLQREITELAYPDGSYTRELITKAEEIGYKYQLAADGYNFDEDIEDPRIFDRQGLYPSNSWCNQMYNLYK